MAVAMAPIVAPSTPRRGDGWRSRKGKWNRRRAWLDLVKGTALLTSSAVRVALLLSSRSDDDGKPVWGTQVNMGDTLGLSERTIRRCLGELEALGLVLVLRKPAVIGATGRFVRRPCNTYVLTVPTRASLAAAEAPRRVPKAGYCRVKSQRPPTGQQWPHNPSEGLVEHHAQPVERIFADADGEIIPTQPVSDLLAGVELARQALRAVPRPPPRAKR
jgi:hypothetical protein